MTLSESFVSRLKRGEPAAYEELLARFESPLYRFFYYDHRDHHIAQEQSAETFAQLAQSIANFAGCDSQLSAFVFSIARRVQLRSWRTRKQAALPLESAADSAQASPCPVQQAAGREQLSLVLAAIGALEQPQRNVLLLRFVEGLSLAEIATALDIPLGTVKSHIHRGREYLRQRFFPQEYQP